MFHNLIIINLELIQVEPYNGNIICYFYVSTSRLSDMMKNWPAEGQIFENGLTTGRLLIMRLMPLKSCSSFTLLFYIIILIWINTQSYKLLMRKMSSISTPYFLVKIIYFVAGTAVCNKAISSYCVTIIKSFPIL